MLFAFDLAIQNQNVLPELFVLLDQGEVRQGHANRITAFISMALSYAAGGILQLLTGNTGLAFTIIFIGAMTSRLVSFYFLSKMSEPFSPATEKRGHESMLKLARGLFSTNIGMFIMLCALITFSASVAGPFFSPYAALP